MEGMTLVLPLCWQQVCFFCSPFSLCSVQLFSNHLFQLHIISRETTVAVELSSVEVRQTVCVAPGRNRLATNQISWKGMSWYFFRSVTLSLSLYLSVPVSLCLPRSLSLICEALLLPLRAGAWEELLGNQIWPLEQAVIMWIWNTVCPLFHTLSQLPSLSFHLISHVHTPVSNLHLSCTSSDLKLDLSLVLKRHKTHLWLKIWDLWTLTHCHSSPYGSGARPKMNVSCSKTIMSTSAATVKFFLCFDYLTNSMHRIA